MLKKKTFGCSMECEGKGGLSLQFQQRGVREEYFKMTCNIIEKTISFTKEFRLRLKVVDDYRGNARFNSDVWSFVFQVRFEAFGLGPGVDWLRLLAKAKVDLWEGPS